MATNVPTRPTTYALEKGSLSLAISDDKNACGPFKIAKELSKVIDPNAKSNANFCGAMTNIGKNENDIEIKKIPTKKTPPNCASFAGDIVSAARPEKL